MFYEGHVLQRAGAPQLAKRMSHGFSGARHLPRGAVALTPLQRRLRATHLVTPIAIPSFFFNPRASRALSDFNVARTLVINGLWELPAPKSFSGPARFLTEGWQLGLIFTASTGIPFTPDVWDR